MIIRKISKLDRMFEVMASMPNPDKVVITRFLKGTPTLNITAKNIGGVCEYHYQASGLLSIHNALIKIKEYDEKLYYSL
jgi:hypothetical protein